MTRELILVGASPKARLVLEFMAQEGRLGEVRGVVDRNADRAGKDYCGVPLLSTLERAMEAIAMPPPHFCIALSELRFEEREQIMKRIIGRGLSLASVVSRTARIAASASIGDGCIVFPGAVVNSGARIGRCVTLYTDALIEHDCIVNDNVDISPRACVAGGCSIGGNSFIGINATILPKCSVGNGAIVGAGAVVTENVADHAVVAGNPARVVRFARTPP